MSTVTTRNILSMEFTAGDGKTKAIRVADPKSDLTATQVETAMTTLNELNAFNSLTESGPSRLKGAKTIQTVTSKFDIVID